MLKFCIKCAALTESMLKGDVVCCTVPDTLWAAECGCLIVPGDMKSVGCASCSVGLIREDTGVSPVTIFAEPGTCSIPYGSDKVV